MVNIAFISNEKYTLFCYSFLESFIEVVVASLNCGFLGKIKDNYAALGTFIVGWSECSEFFLPGSVPNLQGVHFIVDGGGVGFEVDADGGEVVIVELGLAESEEDGALSDSLWSNYDNFEGSGFDISVTFVHFWYNFSKS